MIFKANRYKSIFTYAKLWLLICMIPLVSFCTKGIEHTSKDRDGKYIKLELQAYFDSSSKISEDQIDPELRIDNVIALVFDEDDAFVYKAETTMPFFNTQTGRYEINASLFESEHGEKYSISLLTNIEGNYGNLRPMKGKSKKQVLENFTFVSSASVPNEYPLGKANLRIPMYGETEYKVISGDLKFPNTIPLMRAVSKIDIFLDVKEMDIKNNHNFKNGNAVNFLLKNVHIHNSVSKGRIVPVLKKNTTWTSFIPTKPSLVLSDNKPLLNALFKYGDYASKKSTLTKPIFVQENVGGDKLSDNATLFIVGLTKQGSTEVRYYRVDVTDVATPNLLADLIRNQYYKVHIKDVNGEGSSTPDDAVVSKDVCSASLLITEWTIMSFYKKLIGDEFFDISKRSVTFEKKGVIEVPFKTNIDDINLRWSNDKSNSANKKEIFTDYYKVKFLKGADSQSGKLIIEALKDTRSRFDVIWDEFNIYAGNMIVPVKIEQEKTRLALPLDNLDGQISPHGYFVVNKLMVKGSNSLSLAFNATSKFKGLKDPDGSKGTFDFEVDLGIGDLISIKSLPNSSGITINLQNYRLEYKDFKFIHQLDGSWKKVISIEAPISGKPNKLGLNTVEYSLEVYYRGGVLDFKEKTSTGLSSLNFNFNVYDQAPLSMIEPKVLIVGNSYSFDINDVYSNSNSDFNVNLARLLFNKANFGLDAGSKVKVEPFIYEYGKDKQVKNITHVNSLRSMTNPNELENYNIIIYLDSKTPNEIAFKESVYVRKIIDLVKANKVVFVQTPSYSDRFSISATEIVDPILTEVLGKSVQVAQSSNEKQYSLQVFVKALMAGQFNLSVYYPSRDEESFFKYNPRANFRDVSYLQNISYSDAQVLSKHKLGSDKAIALMSSTYYYLWFGSSFLFEDSAVGVSSNNLPVDVYARTYEGISRPESKNTENSKLFINIMEWAISNLKNLK